MKVFRATIQSVLSIHQLRLSVFLGETEAERDVPQSVDVNIKITFLSPPEACMSDDMAGCPCYATLIQSIKTKCVDKKFCTIEYLSAFLYQHIEEQLHQYSILLNVCLNKYPPIPAIDRVSFEYGR